MSLLATTEVAAYLGIEDSELGLQEAIDNAEAMVAGRLNLVQLEEGQYTENHQIPRNYQQIIPRHGPITSIDAFTLNDDDRVLDVVIDPSGWAVLWNDFGSLHYHDRYYHDSRRVRQFNRFTNLGLTYTAGWTILTLPAGVREYIKIMVGLTLTNFLASGVYDAKLGDMTIKIQREVLQKNLEMYEPMLNSHRKPLL